MPLGAVKPSITTFTKENGNVRATAIVAEMLSTLDTSARPARILSYKLMAT